MVNFWILTCGMIGAFWGVAKGFDCPSMAGVRQPQMSATFLNGYWYERLYINTQLNGNDCSHYEIECTTNATCIIRHVIWNSFNLDLIWNGTIVQDTERVQLTIEGNDTVTYEDVYFQYEDDSVLFWACNGSKTEFASIFKRINDENDVDSIWEDARRNMDYVTLADNFPAGWWKKIETESCTCNGASYLKIHVVFVLILAYFSQKIY